MYLGILLLHFIFTNGELQCEADWREFEGRCYKYYFTPQKRMFLEDVQKFCQSVNQPTFNAPYYKVAWGDMLLVGMRLNTRTNQFESLDPTETVDPIPWCRRDGEAEPNRGIPGNPEWANNEHCIIHRSWADPNFCYHDTLCSANYFGVSGYSRYMCKKEKSWRNPIVCNHPNAYVKDEKCVCKPDFIDISRTDVPERRKYKSGERCIPQDPCRSIKNSFSLVFIIDASLSIGQQNWPSLIKFLKTGAAFIPNIVNVGFVKFASEVTYAEWVPNLWTQEEFKDMIPTDFDAGYTNTPAGIEKALELFQTDGSHDKVAILITDGLPVLNSDQKKEAALKETRNSVAKLRRQGIKLITLGYGPELAEMNGYQYIKMWLEDPEEDYFAFDKKACDLKQVHMQILLRKVCRRYV